MKICTKCKIKKALDEFHIQKATKDGRNYKCKKCFQKYSKARYQKNKKHINKINKLYRLNNKEKIQEINKQWVQKHPKAVKRIIKRWKSKNKEHIKEYKIKYNQKNEKKFREYRQRYTKNKRDTDPLFRLTNNLRGRLSQALRNNYKSGSAVRDLGCSIEFLKEYLEKKFTKNMNWDNYGRKKDIKCWNIDHIKPLSKFDLTDRKQLQKACNYTNLQPLWAEDNWKKGNKI